MALVPIPTLNQNREPSWISWFKCPVTYAVLAKSQALLWIREIYSGPGRILFLQVLFLQVAIYEASEYSPIHYS